MTEYKSRLAPYIKGLIEEKRALGYSYKDEAKFLRRFDEFWQKNNPDTDILNYQNLQGWLQQRPTEGKRSLYHRVSVVRVLALFMASQGISCFIPNISNIKYEQPVIHVLSLPELQEFFEILDRTELKKPNQSYTRLITEWKVLFRLYITTGLRNSEAAGLRIEDVDIQDGILTIYNGKGQRDRLVYLQEDMQQILNDYIPWLESTLGYSPKWLFPGSFPQNHLSPGTITSKFRTIWNQTSFSKSCSKAPTLHCLRHTFVVLRMNDWMQNGIDLNLMMPYLSKYLGHSDVAATYYYYHQVLEAFSMIKEKDETGRSVLPEARIK